MPGYPLTVSTVGSCLHQGTATVISDQTAVTILGGLAATASSQITVLGCPFTTPVPKYQPCVIIKWSMTSTKVTVQGKPLILMPPPGTGIGPGIGQSAEQIPQGPATIKTNQIKVFVT
jgi:hypothetical protein